MNPTSGGRSWSEEEAREWLEWLTLQLVRARYASVWRKPGEGERIRYNLTALAFDTGIKVRTLEAMVHERRQPSPQTAVALARGLGMHPASVLYRARILDDEELQALLGTGRLPRPVDLRATLGALDLLPQAPEFDAVRESIRAQTQQTLDYIEHLIAMAGLSGEELGAASAQIVAREIVGDDRPLPPPVPTPSDHSTPTSVQPDPAGQGVAQTPTRRPGPTRGRQGSDGDDSMDGNTIDGEGMDNAPDDTPDDGH